MGFKIPGIILNKQLETRSFHVRNPSGSPCGVFVMFPKAARSPERERSQ